MKSFKQHFTEKTEQYLTESNKIIAYHISPVKFTTFKEGHYHNKATVLDAFYFLDDKKELFNFGNDGYIYTVQLNPKKMFRFDLNDEEWISTEFQTKFHEKIVGMENELDEYMDMQKVKYKNIDCIELNNLEYTINKKCKEYIVLNTNIIKILSVKPYEKL